MNITDYITISDDIGELNKLLDGRKVFAIVDDNVKDLPFVEALDKKVVISALEEWKNISTVETISRRFMQMGADRDCLVLGIGGGITTDIAGFVAATYKRGVACGLVPTTLLAQIDAAIGGKNGVNIDHFKNMVGTIRQPEFVFISPALTHTTSRDIDICGAAEMIKAFIIANGDAYPEAIRQFREGSCNMELIRRAIKVKSDIVSKDQFENSERRLLNLGHTIGHAIEKWSECTPHGRAVATGIAYAARISNRLGILSKEKAERIVSDLESIGFATKTDIPVERLIEAIDKDKKRDGDSIEFVLIEDIGKAVIRPVAISQIAELIR